MKHIHQTLPLPNNPYVHRYFNESTILFDIETTGFSQKHSFTYLIGMAAREGDAIHIHQFLAQNRTEEASLLSAFHSRLKPDSVLITFNGLGFDIPFLKKRETTLCIAADWKLYSFIDLYKLIGKLSHLLSLPDKKQKSVERFLGLHREDACSGGELISVYFSYEKQPNEHDEKRLLLHNYEDVLGMTELLSLLSYRDLFLLPANVVSAEVKTTRPYGASLPEKKLLLTLKAPVPFPRPFLYPGSGISLKCQDAYARLLVKILSGELRFYYDNFRDYYYLPKEDTALHKSVAKYVDPAHRRQATASTCYCRRTGDFLPQAQTLFTPCFYSGKKTKASYFELQEAFLNDSAAQSRYAALLLQQLAEIRA